MKNSKPSLIIIISALFSMQVLADNANEALIQIQQKNIEINGVQGQLTTYPTAICHLQNIESISLVGHNFQQIPDCILKNGRTLRQLRLTNDGITNISEHTFRLVFLESLDFSNNKISTKSSDDWSGLSKLRILDISNNPITELPNSIGELTTLEVLSLANTQITKLPESFANLASLRVLDLSNTKISITPNSFSYMVNLERLELRGVTTLSQAEKNVINAIFKGRSTQISY